MADDAVEAGAILLAVTRSDHWDLVHEVLSPRFPTIRIESEEAFFGEVDLVIGDRRGLLTWHRALAARRERDLPLHLPVLLLSPKSSLSLDDEIWGTIDDVARVPIGRDNLIARVSSLLRARRYSRELDRQRRLAEDLAREKDEILRIAAHDLKAPAATAQMAAKLLLNEDLSPDEQREVAHSVLDSADRLVDLLNRILDVERIEQRRLVLERHETDIVAVVRRAVEHARLPAQLKNIGIEMSSVEAPIPVVLDATRMEEVVDNLLSNALKYSHAHSTVTVTVGSTVDSVTVSVGDQGIGIYATDIGKLFRKFGRLEKPTAGEASTGLGLAIVKNLVDLHGGRIEVTSERGVGSTFAVILPR